MKPYTRNTNKGRTLARDDIHHATADQSRISSKSAAKAARHGARQEAKQDLEDIFDEDDSARLPYSDDLSCMLIHLEGLLRRLYTDKSCDADTLAAASLELGQRLLPANTDPESLKWLAPKEAFHRFIANTEGWTHFSQTHTAHMAREYEDAFTTLYRMFRLGFEQTHLTAPHTDSRPRSIGAPTC